MHITTFREKYADRKIDGIRDLRTGSEVLDFQDMGLKDSKDLVEYLLGQKQLEGSPFQNFKPQFESQVAENARLERDLDGLRSQIRELQLRLRVARVALGGSDYEY